MRPEVGFNPSWFHKYCGIDFSEKWHTDVEFRMKSHETMGKEIKKRFPGYNIGGVLNDWPFDLLTGIYGIGIIDSLFGRTLQFHNDKWPVPENTPLTDDEVKKLEVPNLTKNKFFLNIFEQLEKIYKLTGSVRGFLNWQGNLNTAFRLRGESIFIDLIDNRETLNKILTVVSDTYLKGVKLLYLKQKEFKTDYNFATIANCTVNMIGPELYESCLLPFDAKIADEFPMIGIHNCAWTVTPYIDLYSRIPNVAYIDMGIESDLKKARDVFPNARRNCLYKSVDLKNKSFEEIRNDFEYISDNLAPCDVGLPDIEYDVPDKKIMFAMDLCNEFSDKYSERN